MRALHLSLRGVKVSIFLLSGVSIALVSSATFARPTHAEGLLPTVRCLVQTLLSSGCPDPAQSSSPVVSSPTQASSSSQNTSQTQSTPSQNSTVQSAPQSGGIVQAAPSVETLQTPQELTAMPNVPTQATQNPKAYDYVAFFNTSSSYASPRGQGDGNAFIQPSQEGWKVAGLAWYWWLAILGAITGVISLIRRRYVRRLSVLSNP